MDLMHLLFFIVGFFTGLSAGFIATFYLIDSDYRNTKINS